jgi:hypothetical protein
MSLRTPLQHDATLPDGRVVHVRVGVPHDSYIRSRELSTVALEVFDDSEHLAAVNTILSVDHDREGLALLRDVVEGLESGSLAPTAGALESLADRLHT